MPIYKFKSFEEAEWALWNFHPDEAYFRKVADLWNFAGRLLPISYPKGVFKFRSMEEANKQNCDNIIAYACKHDAIAGAGLIQAQSRGAAQVKVLIVRVLSVRVCG